MATDDLEGGLYGSILQEPDPPQPAAAASGKRRRDSDGDGFYCAVCSVRVSDGSSVSEHERGTHTVTAVRTCPGRSITRRRYRARAPHGTPYRYRR